jgi:hypothetical protein
MIPFEITSVTSGTLSLTSVPWQGGLIPPEAG